MDHQGHGQPPAMGIIGGGAQMPYGTNPYPNQVTGAPNSGSVGGIQPSSQPTGAQLAQHQLAYQQIHQQQQQQLQQQLQTFWANQYQEVEKVSDFKNHSLPLARIKKIMKADEDVRMISAEAPVIFARACEMFILELTLRSWNHTEENKRRTLQKNDIAAAITIVIFGALTQTVSAAPSHKRAANCSFPNPSSSTNVVLPSARYVRAGETFDGKNLRYSRRGINCGVYLDGTTKDAVFILESGATISNVVIGANQHEGIHCQGPCTIRNVWFEDVCENAVTIKQSSGTSTITGGGAKNAADSIIQHNGGGVVKIDSYCAQDFGKLYHSCGNCRTQVKREVQISNIIARNGKLLAGVNSNYGDIATIDTKSNSYTSLTSVCNTLRGTNNGNEPIVLTRNQFNTNCKF